MDITINVVDAEPCPGCGSTKTKAKVHDDDGWWWKCYGGTDCDVAYFNPDTGGIDYESDLADLELPPLEGVWFRDVRPDGTMTDEEWVPFN